MCGLSGLSQSEKPTVRGWQVFPRCTFQCGDVTVEDRWARAGKYLLHCLGYFFSMRFLSVTGSSIPAVSVCLELPFETFLLPDSRSPTTFSGLVLPGFCPPTPWVPPLLL